MSIRKVLALTVLLGVVSVLSGCAQQEIAGLRDKNRIQRDAIERLQSQVSTQELEIKQLRKKLATAQGLNNADIQAKNAEIAALEEDISKKMELIEKMKAELLRDGVKLPMGLSLALEEFAADNDMVTFDRETGVLKFKSDLLFDSGSAVVASDAKSAVNQLADIMNSEEAKQFDIVIAGHTDNVPIKYSKAKHPTNWHLSAHRAISVLEQLEDSIKPERMSVRGFGPYRPVEDNSTKEGRAANRRVEIYVVAKGR